MNQTNQADRTDRTIRQARTTTPDQTDRRYTGRGVRHRLRDPISLTRCAVFVAIQPILKALLILNRRKGISAPLVLDEPLVHRGDRCEVTVDCRPKRDYLTQVHVRFLISSIAISNGSSISDLGTARMLKAKPWTAAQRRLSVIGSEAWCLCLKLIALPRNLSPFLPRHDY